VTSGQLSSPHGKLMQMPGEARAEASETEGGSYPIIVRSYEPVADLDDRLQRIFTVLSLPPLEDLSAQGPCLTASATRVTSAWASRRWGWVLGTGAGILRATQGSPRQVMLSP
jgi:hypothetical protein